MIDRHVTKSDHLTECSAPHLELCSRTLPTEKIISQPFSVPNRRLRDWMSTPFHFIHMSCIRPCAHKYIYLVFNCHIPQTPAYGRRQSPKGCCTDNLIK